LWLLQCVLFDHRSGCWQSKWPSGQHALRFLARSQNCDKLLLASSYLSVHPSVCLHGTTRLLLDGFWLNLIFKLFPKICWEKLKFCWNPTRMPGTLHEGVFTFMTISRWILPRMRNVSDKSCRDNQNTHFVFSNFFSENLAFYEMSKNVVKLERLQTIWRMRIACSISKAIHAKAHASARVPTPKHAFAYARAHTHTICTYCFSTATAVSWTRLSVTSYVHCLSCLIIIGAVYWMITGCSSVTEISPVAFGIAAYRNWGTVFAMFICLFGLETSGVVCSHVCT
jgi:hypothetical protein